MCIRDRATDVRYIKGGGEQRARALARLGVRTLGDLLNYFPRAYEDRTAVRPIAELALDETACVRAMVAAEPRLTRVRRGLDLVKLRIVDESGSADVTFFNQSYVRDQLVPGESYVFYGKAGDVYKRPTVCSGGATLSCLSPSPPCAWARWRSWAISARRSFSSCAFSLYPSCAPGALPRSFSPSAARRSR